MGKAMNIPITKIYITKADETAVIGVLRSGWITQGSKVQELESRFASRVGAPYAVATSSCTTALHLALLAANVGKGDEVIVPSYTFIATANSILYCGARPVFVDIDLETYNIQVDLIEEKITAKTKAIVVVHQAGLPADLDPIKKIADRHGLILIEDAACAVGSSYRGKKIGSLSDLTCFSLHARKVITSGEGGIITTSRNDFIERLQKLRSHGMSISDAVRHQWKDIVFEEYHETGFNYRMSDIHAALGISQLERLEEIVRKRNELAERYHRVFQQVECLEIPKTPSYAKHNYQSYILRLNQRAPLSRNELMQKLLLKSIMTRRIMAVHLEPAFISKFGRISLPQTEKAIQQALLLPIYPNMSVNEQEVVIEAILDLVKVS